MTIDITDKQYKSKMTILMALHEVADPELGINIVDLGLVYNIQIDDATRSINIEMTLSTPSCPLGGIITGHVKIAVEQAMPGSAITVNLVWEPKWNYNKISEAGRAMLET
jgi:metal-sulfur cluster biosynthetic enzyme